MKIGWPVGVRFAGLGGQGLVTAGAVLAEACARSGLNVAASQSYGSQARGGITRADVIISREEIDFPHVLAPDLLVVFAQQAYEMFLEGIAEDGLVLMDSYFVKIHNHSDSRQIAVDGTKMAVEHIGNKLTANFVMLGVLVRMTGLVGPAEVLAGMPRVISEKFLQINRDAFALGYDLGASLAVKTD